eukprot:3971350-Pleurochrysis_carterae.AAC.2
MTLTWCREREACIAIALAAHVGEMQSFKIILHTYRPELQLKGSESRPPEAQCGDSMDNVLPNRYSVEVDSQSL